MQGIDQLKQAAEIQQRENRVMAEAYRRTLSALAPANFVLVVGAALLSLIAGAAILVNAKVVTSEEAAFLALISSGLTLIHLKLGCERYQAECRKLLSQHQAIAQSYAGLVIFDDVPELRKRLSAINDQFSAAFGNASVSPFQWAIAKARRHAN